MKKLILALALMIASFGIGAQSAQAFPLPLYVTYSPYQVTASVTNPYSYPVACWVHIEGQRNDGLVQYANVNLGYVGYGMTEYAYASVLPPFWFVNAYGYADCWYLY